ncbi:gamma-glutamyl hydrolase [Raphidocelis subcapitata]|uniref:folate gamma-glutamyl hydrolase n=1 Tax=Raphidocelis subcapitata TaxID=307507 RepID=A0A2V0NT62_9CHLO|nr:gamma-glutamyl hydrolase [Raphidocelis subcapitata]|eukprot:GBF88733.1 gamma-glutamyl hydrolase [Raphidocelis subcapitata]
MARRHTLLVQLPALLALLMACQAARPPPAVQEQLNERPIIGILSQPGPPAPEGGSYIAGSYVKWAEAAGARVVPIFYDESREQMLYKFNIINGLLLPGGGAKLQKGHPFFDAADYLVKLAIKANDQGDYFPVHGTCLGMETLAIVVSRNVSILSDMDAEDAPAPLLYNEEAEDSHFFSSLPPSVVRNLQNTPIAMENHAHEWPTFLHIPHSPEAVVMGQEVANFFVREARRNKHKPHNEAEEDDLLIYRYAPAFTGRHMEGREEEADFEQTYLFTGPHARAPRAGAGAGAGAAAAAAGAAAAAVAAAAVV